MFFYEGLSCPHCSKAFTPTDDIVACPVCGAPHHRECWTAHGGCACADAHGTDQQWSREAAAQAAEPAKESQAHTPPADAVRCSHCGAENSPFAEMCAGCGAPLTARDWHSGGRPPHNMPPYGFNEYTPFHTQHMPCGGVAPDAVLEGESARDLAAAVHTNTPYYLPRFERMAKTGSKVSWNWAAFLIPSYWLLFRKQYLVGALMVLLEIANIVIVNVLAQTCFPSVFTQSSYAAQLDELAWLIQSNERVELAVGIISMLALTMLCVRLLVGLFGNRLYMKQCLRAVSNSREAYPEGYHAQLAMIGGTSPALALVGYMCNQLLPMLILMLLL